MEDCGLDGLEKVVMGKVRQGKDSVGQGMVVVWFCQEGSDSVRHDDKSTF